MLVEGMSLGATPQRPEPPAGDRKPRPGSGRCTWPQDPGRTWWLSRPGRGWDGCGGHRGRGGRARTLAWRWMGTAALLRLCPLAL